MNLLRAADFSHLNNLASQLPSIPFLSDSKFNSQSVLVATSSALAGLGVIYLA
jgi:hypothetical protein